MDKIIPYIGAGLIIALGVIGLIVVLGLLISWPLMLLWNWCVVGLIAGVAPITSIWKAWGLLVVCGLLFKASGTKLGGTELYRRWVC